MKIVSLVLLLALVGVACAVDDAVPAAANVVSDPLPFASGSADDVTSGPTSVDQGPTPAVGPGISVTEALESTLTGPLLVNGFLVTTSDGTVYLSEAIAESYPPQPGGARLIVNGLDLGLIEGLTTAQGITWSDQQVQILGTIHDGILDAG